MSKTVQAMEALLGDSSVTEIMVNGPNQVYVERQGELKGTGIRFANGQEVLDWANDLLISQGWEPVGEGRPWAEGRMPDGSRVLIVTEVNSPVTADA